MTTRALDVPVPDGVSEAAWRVARHWAREAAIIALQQEGEITIREAAAELGLGYEAYLGLLAAKGLPVSRFTSSEEEIVTFRASLHGAGGKDV